MEGSEGYRIEFVQVGHHTSIEDTAELARFTGRKLSHIPGDIRQPRGMDFTLYETPDEGRKLYVKEWVMEGGTQRRAGERTTTYNQIGGALYSEEEAREKYSQIFEELLKRT
jgi:hypothetical protein